jgi:hypothetical protein
MHETLRHSHDTWWTETWANHLAKGYFRANWLGNMHGYPAQDISPFNWIRLLMLR